jgi:hypothetical protein
MQQPEYLDNLFYRQPNKFAFTLIVNFTDRYLLPNAPRNWEGNLINWARSDTYYGMIRSFTVPMDFVLDGATILREQFYTYGIGAQVQLEIAKFNATTYNYEVFYLGDIDFTNFKDTGSIDGYIVTCNLVQGGIMKAVKAYADVKYTIPLDVPLAKTVSLTPIKLQEYADWIVQGIRPDANNGEFPALQIVNNDQKSVIASAYAQPQIVYDGSPNFATAGCMFYIAQISGRVKFTNVDIEGAIISLGGSTDCEVSIYSSIHGEVFQFYGKINPPNFDPISYQGDFFVDVVAGEKLFFYTRSNAPGTYAYITSGTWRATYDTISPATDCLTVDAFYLFQQLMKQMNGSINIPCQSYLLTQQFVGLQITCGDAIRPVEITDVQAGDTLNAGQKYRVVFGDIVYGATTYHTGDIFFADANHASFTTANDGYCQTDNSVPQIVTTWTDFFKSMNAVLNVGWGTEIIGGVETSVLEQKSYFFKGNLKAIDVGEVGSFGLSVYLPYIFNSVQYGYVDQQYDNLNGVTEFNSTAFRQFPIKAINNQLDLVSVYRGDSLGIEGLRINISNSGAGTQNSAPNNDVFMIVVDSVPVGGKYIPYVMPSYSGVTTNLYNMPISPARNLSRHGDYLHGMLDKLDGENIIFTSALKNYNLITTDANGFTVSERANTAIVSLPGKLFLPYVAEILVKEPVNMLSLIDMYPTGRIDFSVDGNKFSGFIIDVSTDTDQNKSQKIKLLYTAGNNMSLNIV